MSVQFHVGPDDAVPGVGHVVESEFAQVGVRLDHAGNSTRLRLEDLRTGRVRMLDALELESVIWLSEERFADLLDPGADRWREGGPSDLGAGETAP